MEAATGFDPEPDEPIVLGDFLYVADDSDCQCIIRIDTETGIPSLHINEAQMTAATGNTGADPQGGLALDARMRLYIGDDGFFDSEFSEPNILRASRSGTSVSVFVSQSQLEDFYDIIIEEENTFPHFTLGLLLSH